ncbi:MAG TPA: reverse transcriptase family protein [Cyclobacteriaceae bacterium]|nr:reverse transcriptase family protein [Cyclobacteriaceae bacterium]
MSSLRQQLYDRIKASTRQAVLLEEMVRLGFWKEGENPGLEQAIAEEGNLTKELRELMEQKRIYSDREAALKEVRKQRLEQSKKKRAENKLLRKQKREAKAAAWNEKKSKEIIYLGEDVSKGLNNQQSDASKLTTAQLPVIANAEELAKAMNISVPELRFLSFHRTVSRINHYKRFYIPKKTGGKRLISTPMPRLKTAQYWVLENILGKVPVKDTAHGFVTKRSIVTNATPHLKAEVVINIDMKDFFPSITYPRVKGVFQSLGYSEQVATIMALMCTEPQCDEIELDGITYYAAGTERLLPQGAPTSPAITNIICRKLDVRLNGVAKKLGFTYTRYADDLTFSASGEAVKSVKTLMGFIRKVVREENLTIHPDKIRILRKGACKEVTGIVVNDKLSIRAKDLDRFRALLYQIEKTGIAGKHWNNSKNLLASINGYANFINMVDPVKGKVYRERVDKILKANNFKHQIRHKSKAMLAKEAAKNKAVATPANVPATSKKEEKKPWWKIW